MPTSSPSPSRRRSWPGWSARRENGSTRRSQPSPVSGGWTRWTGATASSTASGLRNAPADHLAPAPLLPTGPDLARSTDAVNGGGQPGRVNRGRVNRGGRGCSSRPGVRALPSRNGPRRRRCPRPVEVLDAGAGAPAAGPRSGRRCCAQRGRAGAGSSTGAGSRRAAERLSRSTALGPMRSTLATLDRSSRRSVVSWLRALRASPTSQVGSPAGSRGGSGASPPPPRPAFPQAAGAPAGCPSPSSML